MDAALKNFIFGTCQYCGQLLNVGEGLLSQAAADREAEEVCKCPNAVSERRIIEKADAARLRIHELFGERADTHGFQPIDDNSAIILLEHTVDLIARRVISSSTMQIRGYCKAKISYTTKGNIKVERHETRSCQLEE